MPPQIPILPPAPFAPVSAIGFADIDQTLASVSADRPLPVVASSVAGPPALSGTLTGSGLVGPFVPTSDKPVVLTLSGSWSGTVRLTRSIDNGATRQPLTAGGQPWAVFSANCCEPVWQETVPGAALYLEHTLASGTAAFRVAQ